MGFFSWKTSEDKVSIPNVHSGRPISTVYLVQPNGRPPISESAYGGHGYFGGINAYEWIVENNQDMFSVELSQLSDEEKYMLGVNMLHGHVCRDTQTGEIWHIFFDARNVVPGNYASKTWADNVPGYGENANDLLASGRFEKVEICDVINLKYPLKFSFNPKAVYEEIPSSECCPDQGYFYDN